MNYDDHTTKDAEPVLTHEELHERSADLRANHDLATTQSLRSHAAALVLFQTSVHIAGSMVRGLTNPDADAVSARAYAIARRLMTLSGLDEREAAVQKLMAETVAVAKESVRLDKLADEGRQPHFGNPGDLGALFGLGKPSRDPFGSA